MRALTLLTALLLLDSARAEQTQDVVFLGKARPVFLRLHIEIDGKPFEKVWESYTAELFAFADRDGSGAIEDDEVRNLPTPQVMTQLFRGFSSFYTDARNDLVEMDEDEDNQVSLEELRDFYSAQGVNRIVVLPTTGRTGAGTDLTRALMRKLDKNANGVLDRAELNDAFKLLLQLDENEDEILAASELGVPPSPPALGGTGAGMMAMPNGMSAPAANALFHVVPKKKGSGQLEAKLTFARQLVQRYDTNKSGGITRLEVGLKRKEFDLLDRNSNGLLDPVEVMRWFVLRPDLELKVRAGKRAEGTKALKIIPRRNPTEIESKARDTGAESSLTLLLKGLELSLKTTDLNPPVGLAGYFDRNFALADKERKGFISVELWEESSNPYLKNMAKLANRDEDDRLTREEIGSFLKLQEKVARCALAFRAEEYGRGLWEILDKNGDNQLSGRELKHAAEHVLIYDTNENGRLEDDEIPYQYRVLMTPSHTMTAQGPSGSASPFTTVRREGPEWFRKMDRNRDGDISAREFLGRPSTFEKLDEDQDGYLSLAEARAIEARHKKKE